LLTVAGALLLLAAVELLRLYFLALAVIAPVVEWRPLAGTLVVGALFAGASLFFALRQRRWAPAVINGLVLLGHWAIAAVVFGPVLVAKDITYILKEGFRGEAVIIFEVPGGVAEEAGRRGVVYRIPEDGILLSVGRFPDSAAVRSHFFFQSAAGSLQPIAKQWFTTIDDTPENRADAMVGIYLETGIGSFSSADGCRFSHKGFRVGTMAQHLDYRPKRDLWDRLEGLCAKH
jgi:hypothetical protein